MSVIRLNHASGYEVNVVASQVTHFWENGEGAIVGLSDGSELKVTESVRSIRGYVKKALAPAVEKQTQEAA